MNFQQIFSSLQHVIMPQFCTVCGAPTHSQSIFCTKCLFEMPRTRDLKDYDNKTSLTLAGKVDFNRATSLFYYSKGSFYTRPLFQLKYHGKTYIGKELGRLLGTQMLSSEFHAGIDCIVPVPLHPSKEKQRGFNQCSFIAQGISEITGIKIEESALIRKAEGNSQTKKDRQDRWESLRDAFVVEHPERLDGKHVLLVDDVITTGATIEASATALASVKGMSVSIASIGIALN